jgi:hypothetical protein
MENVGPSYLDPSLGGQIMISRTDIILKIKER